MGELRDDLRATLQVWRRVPALPLTALLVGLVGDLPQLFGDPTERGLASLPFGLLLPAWFGAHRLWLRAAFDGEPFTLRDLVEAMGSRGLPFLRLAVAFGILAMVVDVVAVALGAPGPAAGSVVSVLLIDLVLTFVTPALAFTTRSMDEALRMGTRFTRRTWPASAPYVLAVPLALVAVGAFGVLGLPHVLALGIGLLSWMLEAGFVGACARFYLRHSDNAPAQRPYEASLRRRPPTLSWDGPQP